MVATYPRNIDQIRAGAPRPYLSCYGFSLYSLNLFFITWNKNTLLTNAIITRVMNSSTSLLININKPRTHGALNAFMDKVTSRVSCVIFFNRIHWLTFYIDNIDHLIVCTIQYIFYIFCDCISVGGQRHAVVTDTLLFMMAIDKLPLSLTERKGFKEFVKVLQPLYHLPCEKTLTTMMKRKYSALQAQMKTLLATKKNLVLTTDLWTESRTTKSYIGLTVHYLDGMFILYIFFAYFFGSTIQ